MDPRATIPEHVLLEWHALQVHHDTGLPPRMAFECIYQCGYPRPNDGCWFTGRDDCEIYPTAILPAGRRRPQ